MSHEADFVTGLSDAADQPGLDDHHAAVVEPNEAPAQAAIFVLAENPDPIPDDPADKLPQELTPAIVQLRAAEPIDPLVDYDFAKSVTEGCDIHILIEACEHLNPEERLFFNWEQKLHTSLEPAYRAYLLMASNGVECLGSVVAHLKSRGIQQPGRKREPALMAVYLVTQPLDEPQRKLCSDYSTLLVWALMNRVDPAEFVERVKDTRLSRCKKEVRERRASLKPSQPAPVAAERLGASLDESPPDGRWLVIARLDDGGETAAAFRVSAQVAQELTEVLQRHALPKSVFPISPNLADAMAVFFRQPALADDNRPRETRDFSRRVNYQ